MLRELAPEIDRSAPGKLQSRRLPQLTTLIRIGDDEKRGFLRFPDVLGMGGDRHRAVLAELAPKLQFDDPSISNSPAAPPALPKARRSPITTSSTTVISSARRCA
jgi:hypothetical protein